MTRLATFVHISDLHFGEIDPTTDDAALDAYTEPWLRQLPWFDGYLGHGGDALRHLDSFFAAARRSENAHLIVTGDLTTVGAGHEFSLARQFLTRVSRFASGALLGLGVTDAFDRTVPGNHDHWPGRRATHPLDLVMFGSPTRYLSAAL